MDVIFTIKMDVEKFTGWLRRTTTNEPAKRVLPQSDKDRIILSEIREEKTRAGTVLAMAASGMVEAGIDQSIISQLRRDAIVFDPQPLDNERIEVHAWCSLPAAEGYFRELLAEIATRWPEAIGDFAAQTGPPLGTPSPEPPQVGEAEAQAFQGGEERGQQAGQKRIILRLGKPGRKPDPLYDEAFQKIDEGLSEVKAYEWFCEKVPIRVPDKGTRDSFKKAMKRRQNSAKMRRNKI